jgi:NADH:ubiquinone reductase (H+-translocating)
MVGRGLVIHSGCIMALSESEHGQAAAAQERGPNPPTQPKKARPRVVIIGAGFGGLAAADALAGVDADVIVIDSKNHHCFQPLLYQVATAALSPADVAWPIRAILRRQANAQVFLGQVQGIDTVARCVQADSTTVPYDFLVIATGVTHSYFGHDDWAAVAPGLKGIEDAREIRRKFLLAFERAETAKSDAEIGRLLTFVIVGGGPTGVEMAGAMAEVARRTLARDFRHIDPRRSRIVLVEAGPRLLPAFPENLSAYAERSLKRMGVEVLTSTAVTECDASGVSLGKERIPAATIIWAAGVKASPAADWLGIAADRAGRIAVAPDLSVPGHPDIFAIGDVAAVKRENGNPVPGIAPAAKQMGRYVGAVIAARIAHAPAPAPFHYRHDGDLATIGRKSAVVSFNKLQLTGFLGWVFWSVAHIYFLIGLRNRIVVAINWLWDYVTFQRGARLISR